LIRRSLDHVECTEHRHTARERVLPISYIPYQEFSVRFNIMPLHNLHWNRDERARNRKQQYARYEE
jgi:hypothetical protein